MKARFSITVFAGGAATLHAADGKDEAYRLLSGIAGPYVAAVFSHGEPVCRVVRTIGAPVTYALTSGEKRAGIHIGNPPGRLPRAVRLLDGTHPWVCSDWRADFDTPLPVTASGTSGDDTTLDLQTPGGPRRVIVHNAHATVFTGRYAGKRVRLFRQA